MGPCKPSCWRDLWCLYMYIKIYVYVRVHVCMCIYISSTNTLSSRSAKEGNRTRPTVLFVFAGILCFLPVLTFLASRVYNYICSVSVPTFMCICVVGIHAQPWYWPDWGTCSCSSLALLGYEISQLRTLHAKTQAKILSSQ